MPHTANQSRRRLGLAVVLGATVAWLVTSHFVLPALGVRTSAPCTAIDCLRHDSAAHQVISAPGEGAPAEPVQPRG